MAYPYRNKPYKRIRAGSASRNPEEIRVLTPSRGIDELGDDFMIDNKAASDLLNIKFTENGVVEKRDGYIISGEALDEIPTGLGVYVDSSSTDSLMVIDGGVLKKLVNYSWVDVSSGKHIAVDSSVFTTSVDDKFFVWDGVGVTPNAAAGNTGGGCLIYDGNTTVAGQKVPKGSFSVVYKDAHIVSGVPGQPYRVYVAAPGQPDLFTRVQPTDTYKGDKDFFEDLPTGATNDGYNVLKQSGEHEAGYYIKKSTGWLYSGQLYDNELPKLWNVQGVPGATTFSGNYRPNAFDVNRYDGEKVTGFGFFQDALIIFKEGSIWQMTFNEAGIPVISRITNAYGCMAHGSIATVENDCYFLGRDSVYVLGNEPNYFSAIRTNALSTRVGNTLARINTAAYSKVRSYFFNERYHLAVPLDTEVNNNTMLTYDKRFYAWSVWDIPASGLSSFIDSSNKLQLLFTSSQNKALNRFTEGVYNDNGAGIRAWWRSRAFHGRKIDYVKWWRQFRPIFKGINGSIIISMYDEDGEFNASDEYTISPPLQGGLGNHLFGNEIYGGGQAEDYFTLDTNTGGGSGAAGHHVSNTNNSKPLFIDIKHKSRTFSFQIENSKPDENFALLGFMIQFETCDYGQTDGALTYLR